MSTSIYEIKGRFDGVNQIIHSFDRIHQAVSKVNAALQQQKTLTTNLTPKLHTPSQPRLTQGYAGRDRLETMDRLISAGRESREVWRRQYEALKLYTDEAKDLSMAQNRFRALNLTAEETARGLAAVRDTANQIGGVKLSTLTDELVGLKSVFGDIDQAVSQLPTAAKMRFTFQALFNADPKQLEGDITKTMRALELMGAVRQTPGGGVDTERFNQYLDSIIRIKAFTRGAIGGEEMRQFVGRGGVAAMGLSPEGLLHMASMMEAMGGASAGTSLMSALQNFRYLRQGAGAGRAADALEKLRLVDLKKAEFTKEGRIKKLLPGAIPVAELLGENPVEFADALALSIKNYGKEVIGKTPDITNARDVGDVLGQITGNRRTGDVLAKMILLRENIRKDVASMKQAEGFDQLFKRAEDSPMGRLLKYEAALDNFRSQVGTPMLEMGARLLSAWTPFLQSATDFLSQHPKMALMGAAALIAGRGLAGVGQSALAFRLALQHSLPTLAATQQSLLTTGAAAQTASNKLAWYRRGLTSLPGMITTTIAVLGVGILIEYIRQLKAEKDQAYEDLAKTQQGGKKTTEKLYGAGLDNDRLKLLGQRQMPGTLRGFLDTYENVRPWQWLGSKDRYLLGMEQTYGDHNDLAEKFKKYMPELSMPSQFGLFSKALGDNKNLSDKQKIDIFQGAIKAFPEAFKSYSEIFKQSGGDIHKTITLLIEQDKRAAEAATKLAESMEGAAKRVDTLKFGESGEPDDTAVPPLPGHAKGGLMKRTHPAIVHRDELVIPLEKLSAIRRGGDRSFAPIVNVNVNGEADGRAIAQIEEKVLAALRKYKEELFAIHDDRMRDDMLTD